MIHLRRIFVSVAAAGVCGAAALTAGAVNPVADAATVTAPGSVPAGPGCPAGMLAWLPSATEMTSGNPLEVAPGGMSVQARTDFGTHVLHLLAGHQVRWLGSTGCTQLNSYASSTPQTLANWSGFESHAKHFTGASMTWTVPSTVSTPSPAALSIWPGIGGGSGSGDELIQAGTEQADGGSDLAWTELFPLESQQAVNGMTVASGDNMAVNVAWDASTGTAAFLLVNYTTGVAKQVSQKFSGSSGGTAEWIAERTGFCDSGNCIYPHLLNFQGLTVLNGAADQTVSCSTGTCTVTKYIGGFGSLFADTMQNCLANQPMAKPSNLDSQGDFTDTFEHDGPVDPSQCEWRISPASATVHASLLSNGSATFTDKTATLAIVCPTATLTGTTSFSPASQQGSVATFVTLTKASFSACSDSRGDVWSAAQSSGSQWLLNGGTASTGGVMTGEIDTVDIAVTGDVSGKTCDFQLTGRIPAGSAIYTNPNDLRITGASLAVARTSGAGCGTAGISNGDAVTLTAPYQVTSSTGGMVISPGPPPS